MCGILYKSNFHTKTNIPKFEEALNLLNHRGPDDTGILFTHSHSFGHKRLAIRDIANGMQPMSILNNHLIYNGELYNCLELVNKHNLDYSIKSDTYILFKMLEKYNEEALRELNGIFAFVYANKDTVLAARDQFGVKPLYYTVYNNDIIIASEIKAILKYTGEAVVNKEGLCELLGMGPSHSLGKTIYKNIFELPPGFYLRFNRIDGLSLIKYYELPIYKHCDNYKETVAKVKNLVDNAIKKQLVSDVGVSSFLSGGLDSTIISTVARNNLEKLDTYSIDYEDNNEDYLPNKYEVSNDSLFTHKVSDSIKSMEHDVVINNDLIVEYLKKAVEAKDSPGMTDIDSSMIYLAKEVSKDFKVVLSGECADEIFGGYPWFYGKEVDGFPWIRNLEYRQSLLSDELKNSIDLVKYVKEEYDRACVDSNIPEYFKENMRKEYLMSYINIKYFMLNLLDRNDRMIMNQSLESRVPYCDKDLVEYLYNVPFKYKYRNKVEKKLLRDAYKDTIIKEVINRKKSPYPKSKSHNYENKIRELFTNVINDDSSIINRLFNKGELLKLLNSDELVTPWYGQLMRKTALMAYIYQIDYWFKLYNVRIEL